MESTLAFCAAAGGYPLYWYMLSLEKAMMGRRGAGGFEWKGVLDGKGDRDKARDGCN